MHGVRGSHAHVLRREEATKLFSCRRRTCVALIGFQSRLGEMIFDFKSGNFQWMYLRARLLPSPHEPSSEITHTHTHTSRRRRDSWRRPVFHVKAASGRFGREGVAAAAAAVVERDKTDYVFRICTNDVRFSAAKSRVFAGFDADRRALARRRAFIINPRQPTAMYVVLIIISHCDVDSANFTRHLGGPSCLTLNECSGGRARMMYVFEF